MRSSSLLAGLSATTLASASVVRRDATCNGDVYDGICCVNGEWSGDVISSAVSSAFSAASTFYTAYSSSISTAVAADVSQVSTFISANSQSLHNDYTSMSSSIAAFAATFTPPADPYAKRDTITIQEASINSDINKWRSSANAFESTFIPPTETWTVPEVAYTWTPPQPPHVVVDKRETVTIYKSAINNDINNWRSSADAFESTFIPPTETWTIPEVAYTWTPPQPPHVVVDKRETVTIDESAINNNINNWRSSADAFEATWSPPTIPTFSTTWSIPEAAYTWTPPDVIFDKRAVSVVSPGLTCHGQAVVTLAASNAASLVASATSAAKDTLYYADGTTHTPSTATPTSAPTSTSATGAAGITRAPILAVGGVAIAFAFAAM